MRSGTRSRASSSGSDTISDGGSSRRTPRRGNDATIRTLALVPPEISDIGPRIETGSPASGSKTAAPGSPQGPRRTSIVASSGSSSTTRSTSSVRSIVAPRAASQTQAGATMPSTMNAMPGTNSGAASNGSATRVSASPASADRRRPPHVTAPSPMRPRRSTTSAAAAPRGLRARAPAGAPAPGCDNAWTSSGSAWSRPCIIAWALAARSSISPARGLAPRSTRGSSRVRHSSLTM